MTEPTCPAAVPTVTSSLTRAQAMALASRWVSEKNRLPVTLTTDDSAVAWFMGTRVSLVDVIVDGSAFVVEALRRVFVRRGLRDDFALSRREEWRLRAAFEADTASVRALADGDRRRVLGEAVFRAGGGT